MADGSIREAIPELVREQIKAHIRQTSARAEGGWQSGPRSEDVLTGDMCGSMRTDWTTPHQEQGYVWRWRVVYRAFGSGNQHSSEERPTGADGIFQIEVDRTRIEVTPFGNVAQVENVEVEGQFKKGILFQSKRHDSKEGKQALVSELRLIENLTPESGAYFEYGPDGYRAARACDVLDQEGHSKALDERSFPRVGDFLSNLFLECKVGVEGMYVDLETQSLVFPTQTPEIEELSQQLRHAMSVQVRAFTMSQFRGVG